MSDYNSESFDIVYNRFYSDYLPLLYKIIASLNLKAYSIPFDDCQSIYMNTLKNCMLSYDDKLSKFETYFNSQLMFHLLRLRREKSKQSKHISFDDVAENYNTNLEYSLIMKRVSEAYSYNEFDKPTPLTNIENAILPKYTPLERKIWTAFVCGETIKNIKAIYNVSRYRISKTIKIIRQEFIDELNK